MLLQQQILISFAASLFQTVYSRQRLTTNNGISLANFQKSAEGKFFSKLEFLISKDATKTIKECFFKCVQHEDCLSLNTIALDPSRYQCELLNWTGTDYDKHLVVKPNSKFMQLEGLCLPNPCQNGGECAAKDGGDTYSCTCAKNYTGKNCEINMLQCTPNPCQNDGICTVINGGTDYKCACPYVNVRGKNCETFNCTLFDFEDGKLDDWILQADAFNLQPTYGDNPAILDGISSNRKGNWYVSTVENRPSPSSPAGQRKGVAPSGSALSPLFVIRGKKLKFLMGGSHRTPVNVHLIVDGAYVAEVRNTKSSYNMIEKEIDVSSWQGKAAQLYLIDNSSRGFLSVDHFVDSSCTD